MKAEDGRVDVEARFGREAWVTAGLAALILACGLVLLGYRFTLPTDGWKVERLGADNAFLYVENVMGAPSGLQPGDQVVAVQSFTEQDRGVPVALQAAWQAGETVMYDIVRDEGELQVPVTLTQWDFGAWLWATARRPAEVARLASGYLLVVIAAVVFWLRPGNPAAGAFLMLNATLTAADMVSATLTYGWPELIDPLARRLTGSVAQSFISGVLLPTMLIRFALVFPRPKAVLARRPWLAAAPAVISLVVVIGSLAANSPASWYWLVASLVLMVVILAHNAVEMRDAVSRAQILWGLGGLIFGFGVLAALLLAGTFNLVEGLGQAHFNVGSALAFTVIGVTLGIAITRYRLFDIEVIIRRTLVYSALTAVLAGVYFGSVLVLQTVVRRVTGGESPVVIVLSTLLIAALAAPLRRRVQATIDRRFYRRKYDAAQTLAAFGASVRDETDLGRLTERLRGVVEETMQPESVGLWLRGKEMKEMGN
jgi:hypothetical protein